MRITARPNGVKILPSISSANADDDVMLWTIALILFVLWLIGWLGIHLLGGAIHILLILAIVAAVVALVQRA
jgi:hypothetical protein